MLRKTGASDSRCEGGRVRSIAGNTDPEWDASTF